MAMTTLLTLAAMFGAVRQNTPRVGGGLVVVMLVVVMLVVVVVVGVVTTNWMINGPSSFHNKSFNYN